MNAARPTALIADDEPLLREALAGLLAQCWPELEIVAQVRNGREAVQCFESDHPDVCFLDVHMPGVSGIEAAHAIGRRAHVVFVTAFDHYAVQAFSQGVLDYLVKPVEPARLADTVARLKERLAAVARLRHHFELGPRLRELARQGLTQERLVVGDQRGRSLRRRHAASRAGSSSSALTPRGCWALTRSWTSAPKLS